MSGLDSKRKFDGLDRNSTRIYRMGCITINAQINTPTLNKWRRKAPNILPKLTDQGAMIYAYEPVFVMRNEANRAQGDLPCVLSVTNGLDAALNAYAGDLHMQRLIMKSAVQIIGSAMQNVAITDNTKQPTIALAVAGLGTIDCFDARPGCRAVYDLVGFADNLQHNTAPTPGTSDGKSRERIIFKARCRDEMLIANRFAQTCLRLLTGREVWKRALANYYNAGDYWLSAVMADYRSKATAGLLFLDRVLQAGLFQVAGETGPVSNVKRNAANDARPPVELIGPADLATGLTVPLASHDIVGRIANWMQLTTPTDPLPLAADAVAVYRVMSFEFVQALYYRHASMAGGAPNARVEFGMEQAANGAPKSSARFPKSNKITDTRVGKVLHLQLNAPIAGLAGQCTAIDEDNRFSAGAFASGSANGRAVATLAAH